MNGDADATERLCLGQLRCSETFRADVLVMQTRCRSRVTSSVALSLVTFYKHAIRAIGAQFYLILYAALSRHFTSTTKGELNLHAYIEEPRSDHIAIYFHALAHFEQCLAMLNQAAMFLRQTTPQKRVFESKDGSVLDRVNRIYNVSHHMDKQITRGELLMPDATTQVWLLNEGITCNDGTAPVTVTFAELRQELMEMREIARVIVEKLPNLIQQHQQQE